MNAIINGVYQYAIDNNGDLPPDIEEDNEGDCPANDVGVDSGICEDGGSCSGLVNLYDDLVPDYLVDIPFDPSGKTGNDTNYHIVFDNDDRVTVCAPEAEQNEDISISR